MIKSLSMLALGAILGGQPSFIPAPIAPEAPVGSGASIIAPTPIHCDGKGWLGVLIVDVDNERATDQGINAERGAVIDSVIDNTPASKAGLMRKDVIVGYNGERVEGVRTLVRLVRETPVGRNVKLEVLRNGSTITLDATVGERKGDCDFGIFMPRLDSTMRFDMQRLEEQLKSLDSDGGALRYFRLDTSADGRMRELELQLNDMQGPSRRHFRFFIPNMDSASEHHIEVLSRRLGELGEKWDSIGDRWEGKARAFAFVRQRPKLGVELQSLNPGLSKYFGTETGALITNVLDDTPAKKGGLEAGDIITAVDGQSVKEISDLRRLIRNKTGETTLTILREKHEQTIRVTFEQPKSNQDGERPTIPPMPPGIE